MEAPHRRRNVRDRPADEGHVDKRIGDCTGDELDTRASRIPSLVSADVPDHIARRRARLRALRIARAEASSDAPSQAPPSAGSP